jgi:hypothetical protein
MGGDGLQAARTDFTGAAGVGYTIALLAKVVGAAAFWHLRPYMQGLAGKPIPMRLLRRCPPHAFLS